MQQIFGREVVSGDEVAVGLSAQPGSVVVGDLHDKMKIASVDAFEQVSSADGNKKLNQMALLNRETLAGNLNLPREVLPIRTVQPEIHWDGGRRDCG
jgi:hypothetical protein